METLAMDEKRQELLKKTKQKRDEEFDIQVLRESSDILLKMQKREQEFSRTDLREKQIYVLWPKTFSVKLLVSLLHFEYCKGYPEAPAVEALTGLRHVSFSINQCEQYHGQGARLLRGGRDLGWRGMAARTTLFHCKSMICPPLSSLEKLEQQLANLQKKRLWTGYGAWHAWISSLNLGGAQMHGSLKEWHQRFNQLPASDIHRLL